MFQNEEQKEMSYKENPEENEDQTITEFESEEKSTSL